MILNACIFLIGSARNFLNIEVAVNSKFQCMILFRVQVQEIK
jgi:hypothetical protein